jgi:branched-subunit amino acid aminotransferase/4-amino-4-deoxychorismate lyase
VLIADEISICGTLAELVPIQKIENFDIDPNGPIFKTIRDKFFRVARGEEKLDGFECTFVPDSRIRNS